MILLQPTEQTKKIKLDLKDRKILSLLCNNARMPLTHLAKKVALSRDAVAYRIKNYEKKGLLQGYRTIVDIAKFGYNNYHLFIRLNNPTKEIEEKIIKKLIKYPFIRAVIKFSGSYDFEVALIAKEAKELDAIISKIVNDCSAFIQQQDILIFASHYISRTLPKNFSNYISDYALENNIKNKVKKIEIDEKDKKILKIISENALSPLYEIAGKVKLSADAVAYRIKKMIQNRIIIKFIPVINKIVVNYNLYAVLLNIVALDEKKEKLLREFLQNDKNTIWAIKTIGKFNVLMYVLVENVGNLHDTVDKLRSLFPKQINQQETLIAYGEYKYTYFPKELF